jgi:hypothetical protein
MPLSAFSGKEGRLRELVLVFLLHAAIRSLPPACRHCLGARPKYLLLAPALLLWPFYVSRFFVLTSPFSFWTCSQILNYLNGNLHLVYNLSFMVFLIDAPLALRRSPLNPRFLLSLCISFFSVYVCSFIFCAETCGLPILG